ARRSNFENSQCDRVFATHTAGSADGPRVWTRRRALATMALAPAALGPVLLGGCSSGREGSSSRSGMRIGLMPKKKGLPYFTSCAAGAREAAEELGQIELIYDGPTDG